MIDALFEADAPLWKLPPVQRQQTRHQKLLPMVDAFFNWVRSTEYSGIDKFTGQINPGWLQLRDICLKAHVPYYVVLHKEKSEFLADDFNPQGHQLIEYLHSIRVNPIFETGFTIANYRDDIHLSVKGHADLARLLEDILR